MENEDAQLIESYGLRLRVRACGICLHDNKMLLVAHNLPGHADSFWSPPGGGIHFGEAARVAVKREFREETGLEVEVGAMVSLIEFIEPPLHAIEIFFVIDRFQGELITGTDPEFARANQIIVQTKWMTLNEIKGLPTGSRHSIFNRIDHFSDLLKMNNSI